MLGHYTSDAPGLRPAQFALDPLTVNCSLNFWTFYVPVPQHSHPLVRFLFCGCIQKPFPNDAPMGRASRLSPVKVKAKRRGTSRKHLPLLIHHSPALRQAPRDAQVGFSSVRKHFTGQQLVRRAAWGSALGAVVDGGLITHLCSPTVWKWWQEEGRGCRCGE